jgi:hypothetical protein
MREIEERENEVGFYAPFSFGVQDIKGSEGEVASDLSGYGLKPAKSQPASHR